MISKDIREGMNNPLVYKDPAGATKGGGLAGGLALREAADALDAQAARIAELEAYHTAAKSVFKAGVMNATHEQWSALENARAALASGATPPDDVD